MTSPRSTVQEKGSSLDAVVAWLGEEKKKQHNNNNQKNKGVTEPRRNGVGDDIGESDSGAIRMGQLCTVQGMASLEGQLVKVLKSADADNIKWLVKIKSTGKIKAVPTHCLKIERDDDDGNYVESPIQVKKSKSIRTKSLDMSCPAGLDLGESSDEKPKSISNISATTDEAVMKPITTKPKKAKKAKAAKGSSLHHMSCPAGMDLGESMGSLQHSSSSIGRPEKSKKKTARRIEYQPKSSPNSGKKKPSLHSNDDDSDNDSIDYNLLFQESYSKPLQQNDEEEDDSSKKPKKKKTDAKPKSTKKKKSSKTAGDSSNGFQSSAGTLNQSQQSSALNNIDDWESGGDTDGDDDHSIQMNAVFQTTTTTPPASPRSKKRPSKKKSVPKRQRSKRAGKSTEVGDALDRSERSLGSNNKKAPLKGFKTLLESSSKQKKKKSDVPQEGQESQKKSPPKRSSSSQQVEKKKKRESRSKSPSKSPGRFHKSTPNVFLLEDNIEPTSPLKSQSVKLSDKLFNKMQQRRGSTGHQTSQADQDDNEEQVQPFNKMKRRASTGVHTSRRGKKEDLLLQSNRPEEAPTTPKKSGLGLRKMLQRSKSAVTRAGKPPLLQDPCPVSPFDGHSSDRVLKASRAAVLPRDLALQEDENNENETSTRGRERLQRTASTPPLTRSASSRGLAHTSSRERMMRRNRSRSIDQRRHHQRITSLQRSKSTHDASEFETVTDPSDTEEESTLSPSPVKPKSKMTRMRRAAFKKAASCSNLGGKSLNASSTSSSDNKFTDNVRLDKEQKKSLREKEYKGSRLATIKLKEHKKHQPVLKKIATKTMPWRSSRNLQVEPDDDHHNNNNNMVMAPTSPMGKLSMGRAF